MKNFWLDRRGPKKTKINVWLGASFSEEKTEELLCSSQVETALIQSSAVTITYIPSETNEMLCLMRVGKEIIRTGGLGDTTIVREVKPAFATKQK